MLIKNNNKYPQKTFAFQEVFWFEFGNLLRLHRYKKTRVELSYLPRFGGAEEDRTLYLLNANQALSQVSYSPKDEYYFM